MKNSLFDPGFSGDQERGRDSKAIESIISEDFRPRKSKAVGFGLVEETQFDQLPNEYEPVIQSSLDIMKPGTSGLQSNAGSRNKGEGFRDGTVSVIV